MWGPGQEKKKKKKKNPLHRPNTLTQGESQGTATFLPGWDWYLRGKGRRPAELPPEHTEIDASLLSPQTQQGTHHSKPPTPKSPTQATHTARVLRESERLGGRALPGCEAVGERPPEEAGRQQEAGLCRGQGAKPLTCSTSLTSFPKHKDKMIKNFETAPPWALHSNDGAILSTRPVQLPWSHIHKAGPLCWARGSRQQQAAKWVPLVGTGSWEGRG